MKTNLIALTVLAVAPPALAQATPGHWYFEIDGDYGSKLVAQKPNTGYTLWSSKIQEDGFATYAPKQGYAKAPYTGAACSDWFHQSQAIYMGAQAYRVIARYPGKHVQGKNDGKEPRRSEQMLLNKWYTGSDSRRYFSLAFRFLPFVKTNVDCDGFIAQWHHGGHGPPAAYLAWTYTGGKFYLKGAVYYDSLAHPGYYKYNELFNEEAIPGKWYRMLLTVDPGPSHLSTKLPTSRGFVGAWMMNNLTGAWEPWGKTYTGRVGYKYQFDKSGKYVGFRTGGELEYQFKVGHYKNEIETVVLDYDNVAYGKRWNAVTKNKLIGYKKSVLNLTLNEGRGRVANDRSWSWNGGPAGDPTKDYNNDGSLQGNVGWSTSGVGPLPSGSLAFIGGHVNVPMDKTDFDFGNYVTVSAWFKTKARSSYPRGLVSIDDDKGVGKLFLTHADDRVSFGVRHPDGTYSQVIHTHTPGKYADGRWHHLTGTYNRFTNDNRRVKIYVDGVRVFQRQGYDKPILRGEQRLVVGKLATGGLFLGNIDEVNVLNYPMTDAEVCALFAALSSDRITITAATKTMPNVTASSVYVLGSNLHHTEKVFFGGQAITSKVIDPTRPYFHVLNSSRLLVHTPQGLTPGNYLLRLSNGKTTTSPINVAIIKSTNPTLLMTPRVQAGLPYTAVISQGSLQSTHFYLAYSLSNRPSAFPGFFNFGIGDNFQQLFFYPLSGRARAKTGAARLSLPSIPMLKGLRAFYQILFATNSFPIPVSNVGTTSFY